MIAGVIGNVRLSTKPDRIGLRFRLPRAGVEAQGWEADPGERRVVRPKAARPIAGPALLYGEASRAEVVEEGIPRSRGRTIGAGCRALDETPEIRGADHVEVNV